MSSAASVTSGAQPAASQNSYPWTTREHAAPTAARDGRQLRLAVVECFPSYGTPALRSIPPGARPATVLLAYAVGLFKETWFPLMHDMLAEWSKAADAPWYIDRFVVFDARNHGDSAALNAALLSDSDDFPWYENARDILSVVDAVRPHRNLIGIGNSFGSASLVIAESLRPGTFAMQVHLDGTLTPFTRAEIPVFSDHLERFALKRAAKWASVAEAAAYVNSNRFFARWTQQSRDLFIRHAIRPAGDGSGACELKCSGKQEALSYYGGGFASNLGFVRAPELAIPMLMLNDAAGEFLPADIAADLATECYDTTQLSIDESGHLMPEISHGVAAGHIVGFVSGKSRALLGIRAAGAGDAASAASAGDARAKL